MSAVKKLVDFVACANHLGETPAARLGIFWRELKNLRVSLGLDAHHPEQVYHIDTRYGRFFFRDNFGDITNLPNLIYRDVYGIRELTAPGVILDVGANIGLAAAWFIHFNPGRPIHCFEPLPSNVEMIRRNCPSATIHAKAVGREPGSVTLGVDPNGVMASSIHNPRSRDTLTFPVTTLNQTAAAGGIGEVALLKIDAEGMEAEILAGASEVLPRVHQVAMETHGRQTHDSIVETLKYQGFQITSAPFNESTGMVFALRV